MQTIGTLAFTTANGTSAEATFGTPGDGRLLTKVSAQAGSKTVIGWVWNIQEVADPASQPAKVARDFHAALRGRGASHYMEVSGTHAILALDAATASLFSARMKAAEGEAKRIEAAAHAKKEAVIRASGTVRRVLRHSPEWPDAYGLAEAYPTDDASDAPWVRYGIPGVKDITVHPRCPSLRAVQVRSPSWGQFHGHGNSLSLVSDADWDLLVAETAEEQRLDQVREAEDAARGIADLARLRATAVPDYAVAAFRRYGGDPDAAWEDAEEGAASLIRQYGDAIEAQGIASAALDRSALPIYPPGA